MEIKLFLEHLKRLSFNPEKLKEEEFDEDDISDMLSAFTPAKKNYESENSDVLIKLIEEYETDFSLISNISFNEEIIFSDKNILIGWLRGEDPLAINVETKEVISMPHWDYDIINFYCAKNSSAFLEAFLIHGIGSLDIDFRTEQERWVFNLNRAKEASRIAGGEKYFKFWVSLYPTHDGKIENPNEYGFLN